MIGAPLGMMGGGAGGGMSQSSSASSDADGGNVSAGIALGDFNFKTASGASSTGSGVSPVLIVGLVAVAALVWIAARK